MLLCHYLDPMEGAKQQMLWKCLMLNQSAPRSCLNPSMLVDQGVGRPVFIWAQRGIKANAMSELEPTFFEPSGQAEIPSTEALVASHIHFPQMECWCILENVWVQVGNWRGLERPQWKIPMPFLKPNTFYGDQSCGNPSHSSSSQNLLLLREDFTLQNCGGVGLL